MNTCRRCSTERNEDPRGEVSTGDNNNECNIYSGFAPEIYILYANLQKIGLKVQIRE